MDHLPAPVLQKVGRLTVVRDDLLPGGTKMRYMLPLLAAVSEREIVYASPAVGYAQIALAHCCRMLGKQAVIFVAKRKDPHPRTLAAKAAGAVVYQVPNGYLTVVTARARLYAQDRGALHVPWGVDVPEALEHFAAAARTIPVDPAEVWACSGSGACVVTLSAARNVSATFALVQGSSTTHLSASPNPSTAGSPVVFTATVSSASIARSLVLSTTAEPRPAVADDAREASVQVIAVDVP